MKAFWKIEGAVSAELFEGQALCGICADVSARNRTLWQQRAALQALARFSCYGFATLASLCFRNKILEYFLPVWAAFAPRSIAEHQQLGLTAAQLREIGYTAGELRQ